MSFTDLAAKNAKSRKKDYKLAVEKGLYLPVRSNGAKYWGFLSREIGASRHVQNLNTESIYLMDQ